MKHLNLVIGKPDDVQAIRTDTGKALLLASHTLQKVDCTVTFNHEEWEDFDYIKLFFEAIEPGNDSGLVKEVMLESNSCMIPWQVLAKKARVKVNAVGYSLITDSTGATVVSERETTYKIVSINVKQTVNIDSETAMYLDDAPRDGKLYGRKNGIWSEVIGGGSGGDADTLDGHHADYFQQALESGVNIKTINSHCILGSGNLDLGTVYIDGETLVFTGEYASVIGETLYIGD